MAEYAGRLASGADTAVRVRMFDSLHLAGPSALNARGGLRRDGGGAVSVVAGTMTVQVTPFMGWVDGGAASLQGGYPVVLDTTKVLTISNGHASQPRTDVIAVVVRENAYDSSGSTAMSVEVIEGTAGVGAPVPTLPASAIPLRNISVPAGLSAGTGGLASGNLSTDRRTWLTSLGGVAVVASATERDALGALEGQAVYRTDTDQLQVYNGSSWVTYVTDTGTTWTTIAPAAPFTAAITLEYRRDLAGNVHLRGTANVNTAASGDRLFTLPVDFRPARESRWRADTSPATTSDGRVIVSTNGEVRLHGKSGSPASYVIDGVFTTQ